MKIALVILHADPARGGAERYTVDLAAALKQRGHEVELISSESLDVRGLTRIGRYRAFLDALDHHLMTNTYDIVHAMLPVRQCDVYHPHAGMAVEQTNKPNALFNPRRRAMAGVERGLLAAPKPPIVIALSEYVKRSIGKHYALPDERLATLFNAVDLGRYSAPDRDRRERMYASGPHFRVDPTDTLALMVAQDFERKGLRQAIEALARVKDDRLKLLVVGTDDANHYALLANKLEVCRRVEFAGGTEDVRSFYAMADFFVLPTRHDPCSLVVLEALAMGLPVISTKFNGATEIMTDGKHGFVLDDPNDVVALAEAMRKMLDPVRRAEMSKACLALRSELSYEHHLDQLEAIYQRVRV